MRAEGKWDLQSWAGKLRMLIFLVLTRKVTKFSVILWAKLSFLAGFFLRLASFIAKCFPTDITNYSYRFLHLHLCSNGVASHNYQISSEFHSDWLTKNNNYDQSKYFMVVGLCLGCCSSLKPWFSNRSCDYANLLTFLHVYPRW